MDDDHFRQLLNRLGLSWEGYRKVRKGVKKRLVRHMQQLGCRNAEAYFSALDQDKHTRCECERLMTVSISRFFRDRHLWQCLEREIIPWIMREHKGKVMVWSAGCALGEEVYSFKILWHAVGGHGGLLADLQLVASDANPDYLRKAQAGIYPPSSLKEVPKRWLERYFKKTDHLYAVAEHLKEGIAWQEGNLLSDPPGTGFQVIFLRNSLLTYYGEEVKRPAFQKVLNALAKRGILIIGAHETIPPRAGGPLAPCGHPHIFQKGTS